jgi:hypothetical protein
MKRITAFVLLLLALLCASLALGQTTETRTVKVHTEVVNSFPSAADYPYTAAERDFINSVPADGGLRDAVDQMVRAQIVHVPNGGYYQSGSSTRYWSIYQTWTARKVADFDLPITIIQGTQGLPGPQGPAGPVGPAGQGSVGPMGPQGPAGPSGQIIYLPAPCILPGISHLTGGWVSESYGWIGWAFWPNQTSLTPPPHGGERPCPPGTPPPSPPVPPPPCPR